MQVNMLEAKNQLSKLVQSALAGEEVIIANHGKPMVRLVKLVGQPKTRGFGAWKGLVEMADDWDSPETNAAIAKLIHDSPVDPRPSPATVAGATKARKRKAA